MSIKAKDMTMAERKERVTQLVNNFKENEAFYLSKNFVENEVRNKFIDPLLECLKWDVKNEKGARHDRQEVITEDRVVMNGQVKHPDYTLCYGGERKMYVEAKQPSVDLKTNPEPALQVRRYAYTSKMPIAVLTDFQELAIYDTRIKPSEKDTASTARIEYLTYDKLTEKFEELYNKISWDAVDIGTFDTYHEGTKDKRGTATVDDDILNMIEKWRMVLAEDIALHNEGIDEFNLTGAVQKIIDRILFLRICEDKEIEEGNQLKKIAAQKTNIYKNVQKLFENANTKFNAGLFASDTWLNGLAVADKTLTNIINALYYPECQYEFSVLPVEILGSIYERFLGKIIRFTRKTKNGHSIEILEKTEVQKAGGVYYTPPYIVKYIVENTIGKKLAGKTPDEVKSLRFVDPACGSGSFLVGAYQYLLDWHLDWYYAEERRTQAEKKGLIYKDAATQGYKLSIEEKKRILLNNIYGVDIDAQAVEVTKLSLFLKLLENEGKALSTTGQAALFRTSDIQAKILPDMSHNIKCGNSLIGTDYYAGKDLTLFGIEDQRKVNAFDWDVQFPDIFAHGGFDCVIGNPPYVRIQTLNDTNSESVEYYNEKYKIVASGSYDLYLLFIYKGYTLLGKDGLLGFIQPHKFFQAEMGAKLRILLKKNTAVSQIVDFTTNQVFANATTYTCLLFLSNSNKDSFEYKKFELGEEFTKLEHLTFDKINYSALADDGWFFNVGKKDELLQKIQMQKYNFKDITVKIFKGSSTGNDKIFLFDLLQDKGDTVIVKSELSEGSIEIEKGILRKFLYGESIRRYQPYTQIKYLLFPYKKTNGKYELICAKEMKNTYPLCFNYLLKFKTLLSTRKIPLTNDNFYKYSAARSLNDYEQPKILIPDMLVSNRMGFDIQGEFFTGPAIHCPIFNEIGCKVPEKVYLAILNSNLFWFFISNTSTALRGNAYRLTPEFITRFSFPDLDGNKNNELLIKLVDQMLAAQEQLNSAISDSDKKFLQQRVDILDKQINTVVYGLYGLTADEVKIVEGD